MQKKNIIVREIKKNIKITELNQEEQKEELSEKDEVPLEEIASGAPSSRLFPQFQQQEISSQELPPEIQSPQAAQGQAEQTGPRYAVRNVTERELRRVYESAESRSAGQQANSRSPLLLTPREDRREAFMDRPLVDRPESEGDEKYDRPMDMGKKKEDKRYPWEA